MKINLMKLENFIKGINKTFHYDMQGQVKIQKYSRHGLLCDGLPHQPFKIFYIKFNREYLETDFGDFCSKECLLETLREEES